MKRSRRAPCKRLARPIGAAAALAVLAACGSVPACAGSAPEDYAAAREAMVRDQIAARGVSAPLVLAAMRKVSRHELVPAPLRGFAYSDRPLPIGQGQTISQPYIVAFMTEAAQLKGGETVLEVGTGSGYQAAVLAEIVKHVYTIEIVPELARRAKADLARLGYASVTVHEGDGYRGWPEHAPFDAILVTAAPDHIPPALVEQLKVGGRIVLPIGTGDQELVRITKTETGVKTERLLPVRFVPMTGEARGD